MRDLTVRVSGPPNAGSEPASKRSTFRESYPDMSILFLAIILITLMILSYSRVPLVVSVILLFIITVVLTRLRLIYPTPTGFRWAFGIITVTLMGFSIKPLRRLLISDRLFGWYRKVMPSMSRTEREALEAGTVWWEGEIFSGRPRWRRLLRLGAPTLTEKEQAFLDGPVEELCRMLDDWEICEHHRRVPDQRRFGAGFKAQHL